ncbi:hypothetical protein J3F83DRAFT_393787 [Trichoderma novae-zelandiae]
MAYDGGVFGHIGSIRWKSIGNRHTKVVGAGLGESRKCIFMQCSCSLPCMPSSCQETSDTQGKVGTDSLSSAPSSLLDVARLLLLFSLRSQGRTKAKLSVSSCLSHSCLSGAFSPSSVSRSLRKVFLLPSDDRLRSLCHLLQTIPGTCIAVQNASHVTSRVATPPHSSTGPELAPWPDLFVDLVAFAADKKEEEEEESSLEMPSIRARHRTWRVRSSMDT